MQAKLNTSYDLGTPVDVARDTTRELTEEGKDALRILAVYMWREVAQFQGQIPWLQHTLEDGRWEHYVIPLSVYLKYARYFGQAGFSAVESPSEAGGEELHKALLGGADLTKRWN